MERKRAAFLQGYNAQAAVDSAAQVIVAADVVQDTTDNHQLVPMLEQVKQNVGAEPQAVSADSGYWAPEQVGDVRLQGIDLHLAIAKEKHGSGGGDTGDGPPAALSAPIGPAWLREQMKAKLKTEMGRNLYRMRKAIVEPVFGQIKEWRGFRRFSLRGKENAKAEWRLVCATHNLLKLFRFGGAFQMT